MKDQSLADFLATRKPHEGVRLRALWFESPTLGIFGRLFLQLYWAVADDPLLATIECIRIHDLRIESHNVYVEGSDPILLSALNEGDHAARSGSDTRYIHPLMAKHANLNNRARLQKIWDDRHDGEESRVDISRAVMLTFHGGYVIADEFRLVADTPLDRPDGTQSPLSGHACSMAASRPLEDR